MNKHTILGIHITDRVKRVKDVQAIFTKYGCNIKTRLGLHDVSEDHCAMGGLVILELYGDPAILKEFEAKLNAVEGIQVKKMVFTH